MSYETIQVERHGAAGVELGHRIGQVDLGSAASISLVYYLVILTGCWIFYTIMTQIERRRDI